MWQKKQKPKVQLTSISNCFNLLILFPILIITICKRSRCKQVFGGFNLLTHPKGSKFFVERKQNAHFFFTIKTFIFLRTLPVPALSTKDDSPSYRITTTDFILCIIFIYFIYLTYIKRLTYLIFFINKYFFEKKDTLSIINLKLISCPFADLFTCHALDKHIPCYDQDKTIITL